MRRITAACACHTGFRRHNNEDNFYFAGKCLPKENDGLGEILTCAVPLDQSVCFGVFDGMGGEVNYFRAMESLLFNYKKLAALVADYEAYTHVELQGRSASISSYSPSSGYTYRTEEDILDEMKRDKIISYHRTRARFEEIDRVVKLFAERKEFHVIRMYYFGEDAQGNERPAGAEPYTWEAIAAELEEMGLIRDAKSARRWRNKIVNDMAVCMFGKPAAVGVGTYRKERDRG